MRRCVLVLLALMLAGCGNVLENIQIDVSIDGERIFADTCQDLADSIAETVDTKLQEVEQNSDTELPDVDVEELIGKADDLGCSPDELKRLVDDRLADLDSVTTTAKTFIVDLRGRFEDG